MKLRTLPMVQQLSLSYSQIRLPRASQAQDLQNSTVEFINTIIIFAPIIEKLTCQILAIKTELCPLGVPKRALCPVLIFEDK